MAIKKKVEIKQEKPSKATAYYTNVKKANIFTTKGRCMVGETISLSPEEAGQYKSLMPAEEAEKLAKDVARVEAELKANARG